jgi:hypothetical protein
MGAWEQRNVGAWEEEETRGRAVSGCRFPFYVIPEIATEGAIIRDPWTPGLRMRFARGDDSMVARAPGLGTRDWQCGVKERYQSVEVSRCRSKILNPCPLSYHVGASAKMDGSLVRRSLESVVGSPEGVVGWISENLRNYAQGC